MPVVSRLSYLVNGCEEMHFYLKEKSENKVLFMVSSTVSWRLVNSRWKRKLTKFIYLFLCDEIRGGTVDRPQRVLLALCHTPWSYSWWDFWWNLWKSIHLSQHVLDETYSTFISLRDRTHNTSGVESTSSLMSADNISYHTVNHILNAFHTWTGTCRKFLRGRSKIYKSGIYQ